MTHGSGGFQTGSPRGDPAYAETKKNLRKTSKFFVTVRERIVHLFFSFILLFPYRQLKG